MTTTPNTTASGAASAPVAPAPLQQGEYLPLPEPDTHCYDDDKQVDVWSYSASQMHAYLDADRAARAPADSVLEDAMRYRWLRDLNDWYAEPRIDDADGAKWQLTFYSPQRIEDAMDDSLDAAVDAARKQGGAT